MIIIKKNYSEYNVSLEFLDFLKKGDFKIRVYEYIIDHPDGKYEAVFNYSFDETDEYVYDPVDEIKLDEYYSYFASSGATEKEAIDRLCYSLRINRNMLLMQKNKNDKIRLMF